MSDTEYKKVTRRLQWRDEVYWDDFKPTRQPHHILRRCLVVETMPSGFVRLVDENGTRHDTRGPFFEYEP